jgi:hypothetical protein
MGNTSSEEVTFDQIDALARALFHKADTTTLWCALDHPTQLYWRKEAVRRLQQERYKQIDASL